ncbi:hypothetical protein GGR54DRAFT_252278 [Hypoxylon sp. NC1633]|nr:hypothetical protein GGR54DRAFT_252278 [Hypoxylon sp. NC1633]
MPLSRWSNNRVMYFVRRACIAIVLDYKPTALPMILHTLPILCVALCICRGWGGLPYYSKYLRPNRSPATRQYMEYSHDGLIIVWTLLKCALVDEPSLSVVDNASMVPYCSSSVSDVRGGTMQVRGRQAHNIVYLSRAERFYIHSCIGLL